MKTKYRFFPIILFIFFFTSCLEKDLEDLPTFNEAEITKIEFEFRWIEESSEYGKLKLVKLNTNATIDADNALISCVISVPNSSDKFPEEIRNTVSLSNIVGFVDLSSAATISPIGNSPVLGSVGDFNQSDLKYEVKAADGTSKIWTVEISEFNM